MHTDKKVDGVEEPAEALGPEKIIHANFLKSTDEVPTVGGHRDKPSRAYNTHA